MCADHSTHTCHVPVRPPFLRRRRASFRAHRDRTEQSRTVERNSTRLEHKLEGRTSLGDRQVDDLDRTWVAAESRSLRCNAAGIKNGPRHLCITAVPERPGELHLDVAGGHFLILPHLAKVEKRPLLLLRRRLVRNPKDAGVLEVGGREVPVLAGHFHPTRLCPLRRQ